MSDSQKEWDNVFSETTTVPIKDTNTDKKVEIFTTYSSSNQEIKYGAGKPYRIYIKGDIKENGKNNQQ